MSPSGICDLFARAILELRREIHEKEEKVTALRQLLSARQSRTQPDPAQIEKLTSSLRLLEDQLESDRAQLTAFEEEFAADCPPRPDI